MEITLNNRLEDIPEEIKTIEKLILFKSFTFPRIIVKINGLLIKKPNYPNAEVNQGDNIEIIHLISGG